MCFLAKKRKIRITAKEIATYARKKLISLWCKLETEVEWLNRWNVAFCGLGAIALCGLGVRNTGLGALYGLGVKLLGLGAVALTGLGVKLLGLDEFEIFDTFIFPRR